MKAILIHWVFQSVAMVITALVIPRLRITSIFGALGIVIALGFVNASVWDAALFFEIPDSLSMHAFLVLAANGLIFWILVKILPGIEVNGILPALVAPVVFTIISMLMSYYGRDIDWVEVGKHALSFVEALKAKLSSNGELH